MGSSSDECQVRVRPGRAWGRATQADVRACRGAPGEHGPRFGAVGAYGRELMNMPGGWPGLAVPWASEERA